jgi:Fic family protein
MNDTDYLEQMAEDIAAIRKWSRIRGSESLRRILRDFEDEELVMYNEADGETTMTEIGEAADVGSSTVSRRMREWQSLGIVEKDGQQWKHVAPLASMGMEAPDLDDQ